MKVDALNAGFASSLEIGAEPKRGDLSLLLLSFSLTLLLDDIKVLVQFVEVLPAFRHYADSRV